ncbi:hypothetical protein TSOC_008524 [Tetrabaena socialis]|uniref:phytol kinase n=1 Tax=Tetrabaena socialis TaxID=47790 RepID=A0A2J7ZY87_9CHLO|nr:hypothetical protein TSOC_008524 [Tetrabaena socialis]|eukprot:PNH05227.1 hypothetical protein TSOC_008524 [Tetrabaena socialis]
MPLGRRDPHGRDAGARAASELLDRGIVVALRRLPALAHRLLPAEGPDASSSRSAGGHPPTAAVTKALHELLTRVRVYLDQFTDLSSEGVAAASAVLEDGAARAAWLRVVAAAVRRPLTAPSGGSRSEGSGSVSGSSGSPDSGSRSCSGSSGNGGGDGRNQGNRERGDSTPEAMALLAVEACDATGLLVDLLSRQAPPSAAALEFVRKLLRMQTLQCLARRLAEASADAGALMAQQLELAESYARLLYSAIRAVGTFSTKSGPDQLPLACLGLQLAEALLDSSVVEHLARLLLLLLQQRPPTCGVGNTRRMAMWTFGVCQNIFALYVALKEDGDEAACATLRQVLSGRCVRHAVLVHGVTALCTADGGPTYGLPDAVRAVIGGCMVEAGQAQREHPRQLRPTLVHALQAVLYTDVPLTPVGTRVAVSVLLRFGRLVVASAGDEWASQQAELRSVPLPAQPAGPRIVVPPAGLAQCAMSVLTPTLNLLYSLLVVGAPEWVVEAGADCWRLVVAVMSRSFLRLASPNQRAWLGTHVLLDAVPPFLPGEPLPSAAPPLVTAFLAGGALPCVERLLRRAGEEPLGPESDVVKGMLRCGHSWKLWCLLLAYGEPRQAAALVATVGKLLRRVGAGAMAEWASPVTDCAGNMLLRALATPAAPEQEQALPEQLARQLMRAACEWLPELSRIALQLMAAPVALGSAGEPARACNVLAPLLTWLPPLLLRCGVGGGGETAGTATASAANAAGPASCAADDLRLLLLEEVRAVPLLGGALRLAQHSTVSSALRLSLAESCCLVAAMWPEEVLRATCANAAGADDGGGAATASKGVAAVAPPRMRPPPPPCSSAWPPELLRALVLHRRKKGGKQQVADGVLALAELLEAGDVGGGSSSSGGCGIQQAPQVRGRLLAAVAWMHGTDAVRERLVASLVAPVEARALLHTCSYRGCTRLAGDSEAEARLQACGRCGGAWYCCRACQLSHWREGGHKETCADGSRPGSD